VLVFVPGKIVGTVHVSPVPVLGVFGTLELLPRGNGERLLTFSEESLLDTASTLLGEEGVGLHDLLSILGHGVLVAGIVLLLIGGDVLLAGGPGIDGGSPGAVRLDGNVVLASDDTDETLLTVVFTPRVSDGPVLGAVLNTIADDGDIVDDVLVTGLVLEDTRGIVLEGIGDGDTTSNGTSLIDLLHHGLLS